MANAATEDSTNQAENPQSTQLATTENNPETVQQQPQQQQESPWKGILFRIFIFWLISNLFRGKQQPSTQSSPGYTPATNLFKPRDFMVSFERIKKRKVIIRK
jgi:fatty acid desaturase